jgi:hypothetical protein
MKIKIVNHVQSDITLTLKEFVRQFRIIAIHGIDKVVDVNLAMVDTF